MSKAFYDDVFGWPAAIDQSQRVDEPGVRESPSEFYGGTIYRTPSGALFGLRPVAPAGQRSTASAPAWTISFLVDSRDDLAARARPQLEERGVPHGEIQDLTDAGLAILSFSDPDGVHLELTAPLS